MSQAEWFVTKGGREFGPFTAKQLKGGVSQGKITPDTHIRKGGMTSTVPASQVKGLFTDRTQAAPKPQERPPASAAFSNPAAIEPSHSGTASSSAGDMPAIQPSGGSTADDDEYQLADEPDPRATFGRAPPKASSTPQVKDEFGGNALMPDLLSAELAGLPDLGAKASSGNAPNLLDELPARTGFESPETRCPKCQTFLPAQATVCTSCGLNLQTGEQIKTVGGSKKGAKILALRRVGYGLYMVFASLALNVLTIVLIIVLAAGLVYSGFQFATTNDEPSIPGAVIPLVAIQAVAIIAFILGIAGRFLCLLVPKETGARGLCIAAIACESVTLVGTVSDLVAPGTAPPFIGLVFGILGIASAILFILFLARLATFLRREDLAESARSVLLIAICATLAWFVVILVVCVSPSLALLVILAILLAYVAMFVMYMLALYGIATEINKVCSRA